MTIVRSRVMHPRKILKFSHLNGHFLRSQPQIFLKICCEECMFIPNNIYYSTKLPTSKYKLLETTIFWGLVPPQPFTPLRKLPLNSFTSPLNIQWRSQGHCFGGHHANTKGVSHSRGVQGLAPLENFEI